MSPLLALMTDQLRGLPPALPGAALRSDQKPAQLFGTLDELFEALTLIQTGKMEPLPIVLVGKAFWERLVDFDFLVEAGTISPKDLDLFRYADEAQEIWDYLCEYYQLKSDH